jgi:hypothetical protein
VCVCVWVCVGERRRKRGEGRAAAGGSGEGGGGREGGGGIPHDPHVLSSRIKQLLDLEAKVPGLDCMWIFKHQ